MLTRIILPCDKRRQKVPAAESRRRATLVAARLGTPNIARRSRTWRSRNRAAAVPARCFDADNVQMRKLKKWEF